MRVYGVECHKVVYGTCTCRYCKGFTLSIGLGKNVIEDGRLRETEMYKCETEAHKRLAIDRRDE